MEAGCLERRAGRAERRARRANVVDDDGDARLCRASSHTEQLDGRALPLHTCHLRVRRGVQCAVERVGAQWAPIAPRESTREPGRLVESALTKPPRVKGDRHQHRSGRDREARGVAEHLREHASSRAVAAVFESPEQARGRGPFIPVSVEAEGVDRQCFGAIYDAP